MVQSMLISDCHVSCVAISGLGGHAFGSFKSRGGQFMWLRDGLLNDLPGSRVFVYGYDTQTVASTSVQNIPDLGKRFCMSLKRLAVSTTV